MLSIRMPQQKARCAASAFRQCKACRRQRRGALATWWPNEIIGFCRRRVMRDGGFIKGGVGEEVRFLEAM